MDNSYTQRYNEDSKTTSYDLKDAWKSDHEKELRYAGDSARESVDKGLDYVPKFMKDAPEGTDYGKVQSASVKLSLANDTNDNELKQSAFDELTGLLSTVNKEQYLKKARPLQEFVDAKDIYDYKHKNYTTTKNADKAFSVTTYELQQFLNKNGYTDKFGDSLKEDGIRGAKTDYAHDQMLEAENTNATIGDIMKKFLKLFLIIIMIFIAVWLASLAKAEYLSARYAHEFYGLEDDVCNLYPECENVRVLEYDETSAEVYYYEEKIGIWILFEKTDGQWKEVTSKCVWSTGSADDVIWPYLWHGYNGI